MYSKFNYTPSDYFYNKSLNRHLTSGNRLYDRNEQLSKTALKDFLFKNESIDGTALKNQWFKVEKADIFLSHSHDDIEKVKAFSGWLYDKFGLTSFIDSSVWGYCDELLKLIDDTYCKNEDGSTYNYKLRNYSTSHVHAMLSSAISEMINKAECIIFFNTPNSIVLKDEINKVKEYKKEYTKSPWIYYELSMTQMIKKTLPSRRELHFSAKDSLNESFDKRSQLPDINYNVDAYLKEMKSLTDAELEEWLNKHNPQIRGENALDEFYEIICRK